MKLRDLDAQFVRHEVHPCCVGTPGCITVSQHTEHEWIVPTGTLADAHGLQFLCPKCFAANGGPMGTHSVICWFEDKVPDHVAPKPGRWKPAGTRIDDLSFVPGRTSNSVLLLRGCNWHGFVTNGDAT